MTPSSFSSLGLLALFAPSLALAGPAHSQVIPGFNGSGGLPPLLGNGPASDGPSEDAEEDAEEELEVPVEDNPVVDLSCQIDQPSDYLAPVGGLLELQWDMSGHQSPEVFVALYTDSQKEGEFERLLIVPNTGSFEVGLPPDLHPDQDYFVYMESAADGQSNKACSSLARLAIRAPVCELAQHDGYDTAPGETVHIEWMLWGDEVPEIYITVISDPENPLHHFQNVVPNNGHYAWTLPKDLEPDLDYQVYLEAAGGGSQVPFCSSASPLFVWGE